MKGYLSGRFGHQETMAVNLDRPPTRFRKIRLWSIFILGLMLFAYQLVSALRLSGI